MAGAARGDSLRRLTKRWSATACRGKRLGGRHRRRWCPHPADHPAALRAPARTRRDHAAPAAHRGRGRGADRAPQPGRRHGHHLDADAPGLPPPPRRSRRGPVGRRWRGPRTTPARTCCPTATYTQRPATLDPRCTSATRSGRTSSRRGAPRSCCSVCRRSAAAHRRGRLRHHAVDSDTTTPGRSGDDRRAFSSACGAGHFLPLPPAPQAPQVTTVVVQQPAQRATPRPQAPVTHAPGGTACTTTTPPPPTPPTTTTPTTTDAAHRRRSPPTSPPRRHRSSPPVIAANVATGITAVTGTVIAGTPAGRRRDRATARRRRQRNRGHEHPSDHADIHASDRPRHGRRSVVRAAFVAAVSPRGATMSRADQALSESY